MTPEEVYSAALERLKKAEDAYGWAESELIQARRAVKVAEVGTKYHKMLNAN